MVIISIIGIDGCGKTTQAKMISDRLFKEGYKSLYIQPILTFLNLPIISKIKDHPFFSPRINSTTEFNVNTTNNKKKSNYNTKFYKKYFFYVAGYCYLLFIVSILKLLSFNNIVICDRFFYQFIYDIYRDHSYLVIKTLPKADLTFFLDIDPKLAHSRMTSEYDKSVKMQYYHLVRQFYLNLSDYYNFKKLDGTLSYDVLHEEIFNYVQPVIMSEGHAKYVR